MTTTTRKAKTEPTDIPRYVTPEEGRAIFERQVRKTMNMGAEEFIQRWEAGEFDEIADKAGLRHIIELALMIPLWRIES